MRYLLLFLCTLVAGSVVNAQVPVTLGLSPDARSAGMGNTGLATTPDAVSQHWNAAKYAFSPDNGGVSLSYTPWLTAITDNMALFYLSGYATIARQQAISASVRYFSIGEVTFDNNIDFPVTHNPADWAVDLAYARRFGERFSMGMTFRYISTSRMERLDAFIMKNAGAFAVDVGAYYRLPLVKSEWSFGLALTNVGTKLDMGDDQKAFLPMNLGLGAQYALNLAKNNSLRFALDINKSLVPQDDPAAGVAEGIFGSFNNSLDQVTFGGGMVFGINQKIFLRGGYYYNSPDAGDRSHVTCGIGLYFFNINFDASYLIATGSTTRNALKNTFRFTLGYSFGKPIKNKTVEISSEESNY